MSVSVFIVDDSVLIRNLVANIVNRTPKLVVAGMAENGSEALKKIPLCSPDVIVCDVEMPVMSGIEFLKAKKAAKIDIPVIMLSSVVGKGTMQTMQCLTWGAVDFITKPSGSASSNLATVAADLAELLVGYGTKYAETKAKAQNDKHLRLQQVNAKIKEALQDLSTKSSAPPVFTTPETKSVTPLGQFSKDRIQIVSIGISTGGPQSLRTMLSDLDPRIRQPILIVQHMPAIFTKEFANSLNEVCKIPVHEAVDGEPLRGRTIYVAPGGKHMVLKRTPSDVVVRLNEEQPCNGHRPSVDVLFNSVAEIYGKNSLAVIMTGMGNDGAKGIARLCQMRAMTIGQDSNSSVVYGMPKVAYELGGVQMQVPLGKIAEQINDYAIKYS